MNLFAYGTLMDPAVWARVAREPGRTERAVLPGHEARRLCGVSFPGLVEVSGCETPGLLYREVSTEALARLDAYEDDFYLRVPREVVTESGGRVMAEVYLVAPEHRGVVLEQRWEPPRLRAPGEIL
jgi:gamma-glutamylcyclotransferase (GGCT)/AIG2-like uncharacterized protein YtfP